MGDLRILLEFFLVSFYWDKMIDFHLWCINLKTLFICWFVSMSTKVNQRPPINHFMLISNFLCLNRCNLQIETRVNSAKACERISLDI